jgi:hypothetical protein
MTLGAQVDDIDVILEFRMHLVKFIEACNSALGDSETDIQRTVNWLENDQQFYWQGQIRSRKEVLSRAQEALRQKQVFKDSTGRTPSAVEEQKAVVAAKKRLQEAEEKLAKTKSLAKQLQKQAMLYRGHVQRFSTAIMSDMPAAVAHLGALADRLTQYASLGPASAGGKLDEQTASFFGVTPDGSMARGESAPMPAAAPSEFAEFRSRVPQPSDRDQAPLESAAPQWQISPLPDAESQSLAGLKQPAPPAPDDRIILAKGAAAAPRLFLDRSAAGWFIGAADPTPVPTGLTFSPCRRDIWSSSIAPASPPSSMIKTKTSGPIVPYPRAPQPESGAIMGVQDGRAQINKAYKELMIRWLETRSQWDDVMSRNFEKDRLHPMEIDMRSAANGMDQMAQLLQQIRRDVT